MNYRTLPVLAALLCGACTASGPEEDPARYVDPYIGTGDHGHVFMGANVPFGMVQLGPTSLPDAWDWCSGYNWADTTVIGFGHTHLSGTGIGDLNDVSLLPVTGEVRFGRGTADDPSSVMWSPFSRRNERCEPGYYRTHLDRYGVDAELTATARVGVSRYRFPAGADAAVVLDLENGLGWDEAVDCGVRLLDSLTVEGWRRSSGWARDQRVFFRLRFSRPFGACRFAGDSLAIDGDAAQGRMLYARFEFGDLGDEPLVAKVSLSAVSEENARANMEAECPGWDFDAVRRAARAAWNDELSKVRIETGDESVRRIFYTALYRTMVAPSLFSDVDGRYRGADGRVHDDPGHPVYTTFSLWDTYRAAHPLMTVIHPEKVPDMIGTMLLIDEQQGKLPVWHLWGNETDCMVGNPAVPVVADALLKGFGGFDREAAYEAMKRSSMRDDRGMDLYKKYGYIPYEFNESVGYCMEYAIADGALAEAARREGRTEDAEYFGRRSKAYRRYFDPSTGLMRARSASGAWRTPFDPFRSKHLEQDYTEGNAWQYTWLVPHDVEGLVACFGSRERFVAMLDSLFVVEGDLGAEASPDISGLIGQYAHGNEPSHHTAYLYTMVGEPWKTADRVRQILTELYRDRPDGLCGNEDVGQMSAWYVLSALGMYQVEPAGGRFWFGSPLVDGAEVRVRDGVLRIEVRNQSPENRYIRRILFDGAPYRNYYIDYADIAGGGELVFEMGPDPADWTQA